MSQISSNLESLPLFLSAPTECSYLPDRQTRNVFVDPRLQLNTSQRNALAQMGFRRSGPSHYRPMCPDCQACESTRIDVANFRPNRQQRRCLKRNDDLIASWAAPVGTDERYALYRHYLSERHPEGGMDPDDRDGFEQFLCSPSASTTQHLLIRDSCGTLLAVAVVDRLLSGLSAVYTFFAPGASQRSLGRYAILRLIDACRASGLPWLYLGYYVQGSEKMHYKAEYHPQQRRIGEAWTSIKD